LSVATARVPMIILLVTGFLVLLTVIIGALVGIDSVGYILGKLLVCNLVILVVA
jgi:hypothetical protein